MDSTLNNLFALIDSGKQENLEMALQLSVNLADEWKWIHKYLQARKELPEGYVSWYAVYSECVRYNHHTIRFMQIYDHKTGMALSTVKERELSMFQITEAFALELHWELFRMDLRNLLDDNRHIKYVLAERNGYPTKNTSLDLVDRIAKLLPR